MSWDTCGITVLSGMTNSISALPCHNLFEPLRLSNTFSSRNNINPGIALSGSCPAVTASVISCDGVFGPVAGALINLLLAPSATNSPPSVPETTTSPFINGRISSAL